MAQTKGKGMGGSVAARVDSVNERLCWTALVEGRKCRMPEGHRDDHDWNSDLERVESRTS